MIRATRVLITMQLQSDTSELEYVLAFVTLFFERLAGVLAYIDGWLIDVGEAMVVSYQLMVIIFKSLAYGLGLLG